MEEIERIPVVPTIALGHDKDNYTIEVELPGVHKKDIEFEASENSFCLSAPRDDIEYFGCWMLAHAIDPLTNQTGSRARAGSRSKTS